MGVGGRGCQNPLLTTIEKTSAVPTLIWGDGLH